MEEKNKTTKPIIETKNLSVTYNLGRPNELRALKESSVKIYPGEYVIIYGPSGCGKSTLLFAIAGLQTPSKGTVVVDGVNLSKIDKTSKAMTDFHRKNIGIIFQAFYLIPSLSVFKNIGIPQIFLNKSKKERKKKVNALLERFGIHSQRNRLPNQLSGGQKQRVAIARSLINDPNILLADEPVGNLDSKSAENVLQILKDLNEKEKRTVILVTHDSRHLNFANRVFHMKDGAIIKKTVNKDIRPVPQRGLEKPKPEVSQELELLMRTYSGLSPAQLGSMLIPFKSKQLVQDVLIEISNEQIKTIQKIVEEFLMNIHLDDSGIIEETLDRSLEKGGVGLDKRTAKKLTEKIKGVLSEVRYLRDQESQVSDHKTSLSPEKIQHLRRFILEKYDIKIEQEITIRRLDKALEMRVKSEVDSLKLRQILDKPLNKGGVGLDKRNAKKITKEMELIMLLKYK